MSKNTRALGLTFLASLASGVVALGICYGIYYGEATQIERNLRYRESVRVESQVRLFDREIRSVATDLRVLASGDGLRNYVDSGKPADLNRAIRRAVFFSDLQSNYDQIRYLDGKGKEVIRVNASGQVVPPEQLQDKSARPYLSDASNLASGQVLISPFDLNVEHGRVENPIKPVLRFATPVFNSAGERRGLYVINYLGTNILSQLQQLAPAFAHRLRVFNSRGYWLKAAQTSQEWGFTLPGRSAMTLAQTDPALWTHITNEPAGQMRRAGGLSTWDRLVPAEAVGGGTALAAQEPYLIIASEMSAEEWANAFARLRQSFLIIGSVVLVLVASCGWFFQRHQQAVAALRQSQALLQSILDNTPSVIFLKDPAGRYQFVNRRYEQVTGWSRDDFVGKTATELLPPEIARAATSNDQEVLKAKAPLQFEETVIHPDGPHTHLVVKFPLSDGAGSIYAIGGVSTDISERKRAEEERDRFFNLSRDLMCIVDFEGRFKVMNPAWESTLGVPRDQMLNRPFIEFVLPEDCPATRAEAEKLVNGGEVIYFENRYRCGDGSLRWLAWSARADLSRRLIYATARDMTEQRKSQEEIARLNKDLQLRAAQLEAANKELEAFSYSVSHDLRAPLRHIDGFMDLLVKHSGDRLDDRGRRYVRIIGDAAKQMGNLIDDLLVFSRMGRAELRRETVDMNALVEQVIASLQSDCNGRNIHWKVDRLPSVEADTALLRQVLANLIGNAIKYTRPRDPAEIEIGCFEEKPGRRVFFVRDNGVGFDMRYADKLFGVFQRLHRSDEFEGTGIGLANVRRIVLRHGGRTWADGELDKGATIYYTIA